MLKTSLRLGSAFAMALAFTAAARASRLVESKIETRLVPSPVEFNVLLPDGYESATGFGQLWTQNMKAPYHN